MRFSFKLIPPELDIEEEEVRDTGLEGVDGTAGLEVDIRLLRDGGNPCRMLTWFDRKLILFSILFPPPDAKFPSNI